MMVVTQKAYLKWPKTATKNVILQNQGYLFYATSAIKVVLLTGLFSFRLP